MATQYVTQESMEAFRTETRGEFAQLRGEMREMRGELLAEIARQTRTTIFGCIGVMIAFGAIVFASTQLA